MFLGKKVTCTWPFVVHASARFFLFSPLKNQITFTFLLVINPFDLESDVVIYGAYVILGRSVRFVAPVFNPRRFVYIQHHIAMEDLRYWWTRRDSKLYAAEAVTKKKANQNTRRIWKR